MILGRSRAGCGMSPGTVQPGYASRQATGVTSSTSALPSTSGRVYLSIFQSPRQNCRFLSSIPEHRPVTALYAVNNRTPLALVAVRTCRFVSVGFTAPRKQGVHWICLQAYSTGLEQTLGCLLERQRNMDWLCTMHLSTAIRPLP